MTATEVITTICAWAAPPLLTAVIALVISKSNKTDSNIDDLGKKVDALADSLGKKIDGIEEGVKTALGDFTREANSNSQRVLEIQAKINGELMEISKLNLENKAQIGIIKRWLEEFKDDHGRVIHLEKTVQHHGEVLHSAKKLFVSHNAEIIKLKKNLKEG